MKLEKFLGHAFAFCGALLIVLLVGWLVTAEIVATATGKEYTEEKFWIAEQYYCETNGMEAHQYISQQCSLFGCVEVERTKCVGDNRETKIDYSDEIFCHYTMEGDLGWC